MTRSACCWPTTSWARASGADRLVVRTIVSSRLLDAVAAHHGATAAATLTGFKHVMGAARARPDLRLVLGYEEALGFAVGDEVRDKDGIGAALVMADLVARLKADGRTLDDRLDELAVRHGLHLAGQPQLPVRGPRRRRAPGGGDGRRCGPIRPRCSPGDAVERVVDHLAAVPPAPVADVVVLELGAGSLDGRPTERHRAEAEGLRRGGRGRGRRPTWRPPGPGPRRALDGLHRALAGRLGFPSGGPALG